MLEIIPPTTELSGNIILPGSKSITNRALLLAALADSKSEIRGALKSNDTKYMATGLRQLGIKIEEPDTTTFVVHGTGGKLKESTAPLFLGNAGTATRFLTAASILVDGSTIIEGDVWMKKRPIKDLVDALKQLGAKIDYLESDGCPPLRIISDGKIKNQEVKIRADISSQFLSALLMIAPLADQDLKITTEGELTSQGYLAITRKVISTFGASVENFEIKPQKYSAENFAVEPDASSATYFWGAEKLLEQKIEITNAPENYIQPDGASEKLINDFPNWPNEINGEKFPDAVPTLAVLAAFSGQEIRFTGIANLRVKECDRIAAIAKNLNKIKPGLAEEVGDDLIIYGDLDLTKNGQPAEIETFDDHRIAMAFFLVGLKIPGIKIDNPDCVDKSFPNFWEIWESLGVKFL